MTNPFIEHRPLLFSIAYRMLGSAMEAEDMVQETYLRWQGKDVATIKNPRAFLTKITTRLCIDHLRSAQVQRESYIGPWLPEPLVTSVEEPPDMLELSDSLSFAFLVMLERLSPLERAVFILREVFAYDYAEISAIVEKSETNCRQILRRAKQHLHKNKPRFDTPLEAQQRLLGQFLQTCLSGDVASLADMLHEDVVVWSDGGGKVIAAQKPVRGRNLVTRFIGGILRMAPDQFDIRPVHVNGQMGFLTSIAGKPFQVATAHIENGKIRALYFVLNPDKLRRVDRLQRDFEE